MQQRNWKLSVMCEVIGEDFVVIVYIHLILHQYV